MSKKFVMEDLDKETRIRKQEIKRKSKMKDKTRGDVSEKKAKSRKANTKNLIKEYDIKELIDSFDDLDFDESF